MNSLLTHIKDLAPSRMTVFITEPVRIERTVFFIPARANQERFAKETQVGFILTDSGRRRVKETLEKLYAEANFYVSNKDGLHCFYENYLQEHQRIQEAYLQTNEQLKMTIHWHDRAVLFRQKCNLEKQLNSLYVTMYESQFGEDAVYIAYELLEALLEKKS